MIEVRLPKHISGEFEQLLNTNGIQYNEYMLKSATAPAVYQIIELALSGINTLVAILVAMQNSVAKRHVNENKMKSDLDTMLEDAASLFGNPLVKEGKVVVGFGGGKFLDLQLTTREELEQALTKEISSSKGADDKT